MSSFHVDQRVDVKLEYELAIRLGELILSCGTEDKQILALGHKLVNMEEESGEAQKQWRPAVRTERWEESEYKPANMQDKVMSARRKFGWKSE